MPGIRITQFGGKFPRTSPRLIPDSAAQVAANCRLTNGELEPVYSQKLVYTTGKAGDQKSIHRASDSVSYAWMTWPKDVDVARSPIPGLARWVFTGDAEPRITDLSLATAGGGTSYPNQYYTLGIPAPKTAPAVSHSGGTGSATSRVYVYTFFSQWGEESAPSPANALATGKVDGTWAITGMDAFPANSGTVTGAYASGETTFNNTTNHWLRVGEEVVIAGATMVVTATPTAATFKVSGDYHSATTWARKAPWNTTGMKRRLYRSAGTNATYQLVHDDVPTSYNDTLSDAAIMGDELITFGWNPPPVGLSCVFSLPSGALCGILGNTLKFCEPFQVHAWLDEYDMSATHEIVAAASFGTGIAAATTSAPYIVTGVDPGTMSGVDWSEVLPCVSKRSMMTLGNAALYASTVGMVSISASGASIWSEGYFTKNSEWSDLNPDTMVGAYSGREVFVHYVDDYGTHGNLDFVVQESGAQLKTAEFSATALYSDQVTGKLYFAFGQEIFEYDNPDQYAMALDWMSKEFVLPKPQNLGAAKIDFDSTYDEAQAALVLAEIAAIEAANAAMLATGNVGGGWNARRYNMIRFAGSELEQPPSLPPTNEITFSLYIAGKLKFSRVVNSSRAFKLPEGYKADRVAVRVGGKCHIQSIVLGETIRSLEQA